MPSELRLPSLDDLQAVVDLLTGGGTDYKQLPIANRVEVMRLAIEADKAQRLALLDDIRITIDRMETDTTLIGDWFKHSKPLDSYLLRGI